MRKLIIYPNCSKGGVSSVIRGRASYEPGTKFDVVFFHDRGGKYAFDDLKNITVRIIREDRSAQFLQYITSQFVYDEISVLSHPNSSNVLSKIDSLVVTYEFHSSNMEVVSSEINKLELDRLARIAVPSKELAHQIEKMLPPRLRPRLEVQPNLIDLNIFNQTGVANFLEKDPSNLSRECATPLVWVGRFDKEKGYHYLVRAFAELPAEYELHVVVSLESDPIRVGRFLSECDALAVRSRVSIYMDLRPQQLANLYRSAARRGGTYVSTSLNESFGYAVLEAEACGLRVVAFDLPVFRNHRSAHFELVPTGDVQTLANRIKGGF